MNKKHLHICHSLDFGGITTFVNSLVELNNHNKIKHKILVWLKSVDDKNVIAISNSKDKKKAFKTAIKEYDTLFVHSLKPFMISELRRKKNEVYLFQHGLTFGKGFRKLTKQIFYFTVINILGFKVVCSSEFAKQKLLKNISVFNKKLIKIIPFGVNLNHSISVSQTTEIIHLGFAGRLVSQKRVDFIFEAFNLLDCNPVINFTVAGTGPLMESLKHKANKLANTNITSVFEGQLDDMSDFFSKIDVLILPSIGESYGLVVLEAFSNNVPVIVFKDTGACVDFIIPGENGYVVDDISELSKLICKLSSIDLRRQLKLNINNMNLTKYHISNTKLSLDEL